MTIRVVVVDDQEVVRAGFAALLETQADITVVGTAADGEEAVRVCSERRPDVVLMDVRMPTLDGIEATRQLGADDGAAPKVIMLTTFDLDEYVYDALGAGASGFLLKDVAGRDAVRGRSRRRSGGGAARPDRHPPARERVRAPPTDAAAPARGAAAS